MNKIKSLKLFSIIVGILLLTTFLLAQSSMAQVQVVTSTPDFAAIAKDIGGDRVEVISLAKGYQNPHYVDAKPIFVTKLNQADLLVYNGLELEIGWLPILITGARNSNILQSNNVGHYDASLSIDNKLEVPTGAIDRSMGDIHPGGNPHYMLNPNNAIPVARSIAARLIRIDPANAEYYEENFNNFVSTLKLKISEWQVQLAPFKGTKLVTYHRLWSYFIDWAGFKLVGTIEPIPGVPPSPSHVAELITLMELEQVKLIISSNFYPRKTPEIIAQKTGATSLVLPAMVGGEEGINTYFELIDTLVGQITSTLGAQS